MFERKLDRISHSGRARLQRVAAMALTLCMVISLLPAAALADEGEQLSEAVHTHCICGGSTSIGDHTTHEQVEFVDVDNITDLRTAIDENKNVHLIGDILQYPGDGDLTIPDGKKIAICLDGFCIGGADSEYKIVVNSGATLTLTNCSSTIFEDAVSIVSKAEHTIEVNGGTLNLYAGGIANVYHEGSGDAIYNNGGTVNVYHVIIKDGVHTGTGIYNLNDGEVNFFGGSIDAAKYGIYNGGGTVEISGGTITNNGNTCVYTGKSGGIEAVTNISGTAEITNTRGYTVSYSYGSGTISGGTITSTFNHSLNIGYGGTVTVSGGTIETTESSEPAILLKGYSATEPAILKLSGSPALTTAGGYAHIKLYDETCTISAKDGNGKYYEGDALTIDVGSLTEGVVVTNVPAELKDRFTDENDTPFAYDDAYKVLYLGDIDFSSYHATDHCLCGTGSVTAGNHSHTVLTGWTAWDGESNITAPGNYYLTQNLETTDGGRTVDTGGTVNLCLNGHTLKYKEGTTTRALTLAGGDLNISDCSAGQTGEITKVENSGNGAFSLYGGYIDAGIKHSGAGTVNLYGGYVDYYIEKIANAIGTINVYGGTVNGGSNPAIYCLYGSSGTVNVYGGTLCSGGDCGIQIGEKSTVSVSVSGGVLTGNLDNSGTGIGKCGIYAKAGTVNITGGTISGYYGLRVNAGSVNLSGTPSITGTGSTTMTSESYEVADIRVETANVFTASAYTGKALTINCSNSSGIILPVGSVIVTGSTDTDKFSVVNAKHKLEVNGDDLVLAEHTHIHTWAEEWSKDETGHWHACTADGCDITNYSTCTEAGAAYAAHSGTDDGDCTTAVTCTSCGYVIKAAETEHSYTNDDDETCDNEWCSYVRPLTYGITLYANGGTGTALTSYTFGTGATLPTDYTKTGYTFAGWYDNADFSGFAVTAIGTSDKGNKTYYAKWTANTETAYTVEHYQQNLDDDEYTLVSSDTENRTGTTGAGTAAEAKTYTGFTAQTITQETIAADGSTVVQIYYNRNTYTVTWKNGDDTLETDTGVKYGAVPTYNGATPTKTATDVYTYTFIGWSPTVSAVTGDVTYMAQFSETANKYTYTFYDADGTTVLETATANYGETITAPAKPSKDQTDTTSYYFDGWYTEKDGGTQVESFGTVTGDVSYYAHYTAKTRIDKPTAGTTVYVYTGKELTYKLGDGYDEGTMTISGNVQTAAGRYTVTVKPQDGYEWKENKETDPTFTFTIIPAAPTEDEGYTVNYSTETVAVKVGYEYSTDDGQTWITVTGPDAVVHVDPGDSIQIRKSADGEVPAGAEATVTIAARPDAPSENEGEGTSYTVDYDAETITAASGYEVAIETGEWTTGPVHVEPGTAIQVRKAADTANNAPAGEVAEFTAPDRQTITENEKLAVDTATETVMVPKGYSYTINGQTTAVTDDGGATVKLEPGTTLTYWKTETDAQFKSDSITLTAPARQSITAVAVNGVAETVSTTTAMEYRIGGGAWSGCTDGMQLAAFGWNGSAPVSVDFRYIATTESYAGEVQTLNIPARAAAPDAPAVTSRTDNKIEVTAVEGQEYRLGDTGVWQTGGSFADLTAGTAYTICTRIAATETAVYGNASIVSVTTKTAPEGAPVVGETVVTDTTVTLPENDAWEYSTDGINWSSTCEFTGLNSGTQYTYYVRAKETDTAMPSAVATVTAYTAAAAPEATEGYDVDYAAETITVSDGYGIYTDESCSTSLEGSFIPGTTYYVRKEKTDTVPASAATAFTMPPRREAPTGVEVTGETVMNKGDGMVSGVSDEMEFSTDGGKTWEACPDAVITGLAAGTSVMVRMKATGDAVHGEALTLTVAASDITLTVSFDGQGGTAVDEKSGLYYEETIEELPTTTREGYTFGGWFTDVNADDTELTLATPIVENVTYKAKWTANTYTVKFDANGGVGKMDDVVFDYDKEEGLPVNTFTREDFTFRNWKDDEGNAYTDGQSVQNLAAEQGAEVVLHAQWSANPILSGTITGAEYSKVTAKLVAMDGSETEATVTGGASPWNYVVSAPAGQYNLVVVATNGEKSVTVTKLVALTADTPENNVELPAIDKNSSVVKIKPDTPKAIVGGLDQIADAIESENPVTITLTVEQKADVTASTAPGVDEELKAAQTAIKTVAGGRKLDFIDMTLTSDDDDIGEDNSIVLEIVIPFTTSGRQNITVYRYHGSEAAELKKDTAENEEEYFTVGKGFVTVYAKQFSTYAIGYTIPAPPPPTTSTYPPTVAEQEHGSVALSSKRPAKGQTVTITAKPDEGYEVDTVIVTGADGKKITVTAKGGNIYTFTQPGGKVTVTVTFKAKALEDCDGGANCPSAAYRDLNVGMWYHKATDYVLTSGVMGGYNADTFGPYDTLSRAMMAQLLYNLEGRPAAAGGMKFNDVSDSDWYADAVVWASASGIVKGQGDGSFGPNMALTREQMATFLYRWSGSPKTSAEMPDFPDAGKISDWAMEAMRWAVENDIIHGVGGMLAPNGKATRVEAAQLFYNLSLAK